MYIYIYMYRENLINENIAEGLKVKNPKSPNFYLKPKLNKEGIPGRPVITSVNCHMSKIGVF